MLSLGVASMDQTSSQLMIDQIEIKGICRPSFPACLLAIVPTGAMNYPEMHTHGHPRDEKKA